MFMARHFYQSLKEKRQFSNIRHFNTFLFLNKRIGGEFVFFQSAHFYMTVNDPHKGVLM